MGKQICLALLGLHYPLTAEKGADLCRAYRIFLMKHCRRAALGQLWQAAKHTFLFCLYWRGTVSSKIMSGVLLPNTEAAMGKVQPDFYWQGSARCPRLCPKDQAVSKGETDISAAELRVEQGFTPLPQDRATTCSSVFFSLHTNSQGLLQGLF